MRPEAATLYPTTLIRRVRPVPVGGPAPASVGEVRTGAAAPVPPLAAAPVDLLIEAGRVTAIGADLAASGVDLAADGVDLVLDADGRWAIPGLWDAHVHLRQWAQTRNRLDVSAARSAAEVCELVARHATTRPADGSPILGYGHRSAAWPDLPTVAALDAVGGLHPVILTSGDAHNGWLNTAALQLLGVPDTTGPIVENDWFALMPAVTELAGRALDDFAAVEAAVADAAARGVVGITDFEFALGFLDWPERFASGVDRLRVRPAVYPDGLDAVIAAGLGTGDGLPGTGALATMGPLKIISDGSLNTRTAYCCEPYVDSVRDGSAPRAVHPNGLQNYDSAELVELLGRATANRLQVALHAIGDAAVQAALDAFAATGARGGIEHAQLMRRDDVPRMAALGLRASVQPVHLLDDRDITALCWPDRADRLLDWK